MELAWIAVVLLMALGVAGCFLPAVPGAPLIFLGAVLHYFLLPGALTVWTLAALAILAAVSVVLDAALTLGGAKLAGASSYGIVGAGLGGLVGIFFGIPGIVIGSVLGAVLAEMQFSKRTLAQASKAGLGAGVGLIASSVGRALLCLLMIAVFVVDCLWN